MSENITRKEQALAACEKVINGVEDNTISAHASLLLCKKIARLVNDEEGQEWLDYEYNGYPREDNGHLSNSAWLIGKKHGRTYKKTDNETDTVKEYMFCELVAELEQSIESMKASINNYSTQGFSVAGDGALLATARMNDSVARYTSNTIKQIRDLEKRLSILRSQYYDYAVKWQIQLLFGKTTKTVFEEYQEKVDIFCNELPLDSLRKLKAIEDMLDDGNPEKYSQILTSCRRLWSDVAKYLFGLVLPNYTETTFLTKNGKAIDVSGDHDNNKLSAVIEVLQDKSPKNTLVGSETIYLVDWIEQISKSQSTGVHSNVTREQAIQCIIHTYIALGDILSLKNKTENM